jgi:DNA-directed RNA polymerase specialized sigma24 family protein
MAVAPNKPPVEQLRNELAARFQRPLMTFFLRRVRDRSLAEDLTQDVLLKVVRPMRVMPQPGGRSSIAGRFSRSMRRRLK